MNRWKKEASPWALASAGVTEAWQQAAERANRELKAERRQSHHRDVTDLVGDIERMVLWQQEEERKAITGRGQYRLAASISHLQLTEVAFSAMSQQEQQDHFNRYLLTRPGNL
jgi:hypothetical protein